MANLGPLNLKDITRSALERIVVQLLNAEESEEKKILDQLKQPKRKDKNDLADLDEEMHGKHPAPKVTDEDMPYEGDDELPDVPKKKGKK